MSNPVPWKSILRCPLCHSGGIPAFIGESAYACEACGQRFRLSYAAKPKPSTRTRREAMRYRPDPGPHE